MRSLRQDVRYGLRRSCAALDLPTITVVILALGIRDYTRQTDLLHTAQAPP